jgi:GH18 family chitinase
MPDRFANLFLFDTRYLDQINLMTYDFHGGSFDSKTGHNSPLKGHPQETGNDAYFNVVSVLTKIFLVQEISNMRN